MNRAATLTLSPLGGIYGLVIKARNAFYRRGVFRAHAVGAPVISVGNLTTGGTGKTPLVEWIAIELARYGRRVCVLTRGYGRKTSKRRVIVSDGKNILSDAMRAGDEALLLAERLKGQAAVISDADRVSAAKWAIENLNSDVFVLDDGFQHRSIARSLDIIAIDATNPWGNGHLLPGGILREPQREISRADCIVITRADESDRVHELCKEIERISNGIPVFLSRMKRTGLRSVATCEPLEPGKIKSSPVAAFCAIGNPQSFFSLLRREGYDLINTRAFRDHYTYTQVDIDRITRDAVAHKAQAILTTAKDDVKLRSLSFALPCHVADIAIEIDRKEDLSALLSRAIQDSR